MMSMISLRAALTSSATSSGISTMTALVPKSSSFQMAASILSRSTMPLKSDSRPIGHWMGSGLALSRSRIILMVRWKWAPVRSILLTKQMRGTLYWSAWRQTVSDWVSTPATASNTTTPPSSTRRLRWTSAVKSIWPGVSMILIWWSSQ